MLASNSRQAFSNKIALSTVDGHMGKEKSKSTEFLDKCRSFYLDTCTVVSARAHSTWDLSSGESCDTDKPTENSMLSRTRSSTKRSKGIPCSVKYAVSPTIKVDHSGDEGMDTKPSSIKLSGTDVLDQTLNCIKAKLNTLQNERVEMEKKMTHIMEDIRSALTQAHHTPIPKGCRIYTKSKSSEGSMNKQENSSSQISISAQDMNQPLVRATRDLSPTGSPTSFFNRGISIRQKLTSVMLSPTQFIRQATTPSKSSTLPTSFRSADSVCNVNQKKIFRNSMPAECAIICTIPEDSNEATNQYATHHKPCDKTEDRLLSSRNTIVRRSSLTGQLEQCHKLPAQSRDDFNIKIRDRSDRVQAKERSRKAASMFTHKIITATRHTSKLSVNVILLPSTETTV